MPDLEERVRTRDACAAELMGKFENGTARCGVIGLGFIGSVLMDAIIHSGFEANGFDRSPAAVNRFRNWIVTRHENSLRPFGAETDATQMAESDVVFVAVRNLWDTGELDEEPLRAAALLLKSQTTRPRLIILESTVAPGATARFAEWLGLAGEESTFLANAPERLSAGHDREVFRRTPHLVGGIDSQSTQVAASFLQRLCDTVVPVSSPEVSELCKLLENGFLSINIAYINEVTRICEALGIRAQEVCEAAATKPFGYYPFYPGPGVGGHCLPNDLALLAHVAGERGGTSRFLQAAIESNESAPLLTVRRLGELFSREGVSMDGAQILLVGVGFKRGWPDTTLSPAFGVARELRTRGASLSFLDSSVSEFAVDGQPLERVTLERLGQRAFDAVLLLAGDPQVAYDTLAGSSSLILDAGGRKNMNVPAGVATL